MSQSKEKIRLREKSVTKKTPESTLQDSQRFLRTLISNLPGYVYRCQTIDGEWRTLFGSEGIYELTGYHASEFLKDGGMYYGSLVHPDDHNATRETVIAALNSKKPYQITYRIKTASGDQKWVWEQGRGIYDKKGEIIATEGFITDITEKKLAEEEILKRNEELSALSLIGQSLSKLARPSEILELIYNMTGRLFDNKNLYIALYDETNNQISFPIYAIEGELSHKGTRKFSNGLTEHVIKTRKPLFIENNIEQKIKELGIDMMGKKSKCLLAVPMIVGNSIIGVIALQDYQKENTFKKPQIELLSTIASQAAIALENAHLYAALHKELHQKKETEKKIKSSLREKEILLQELHHRVKNNLQIMSSLLRLQASFVKSKESIEMFRESENRIKSMVIIHNKLYNSKNYEKTDFGDYVRTLTDNLFLSFGINTDKVKIKIDLQNIKLNLDTAIPCGLIINELVSNSLKYAFPDSRKGYVNIILRSDQKHRYTLTVEDNGTGLPEGFSFETNNSLGTKLVHLLTKQLGGTIKLESGNGVKYLIEFNEVKYKKRTEVDEDVKLQT